jgi:hypothetical protein
MAVLKVKTTVVCGETPLAPVAGTVERMTGWALARSKQMKAATQTISREFMARIQWVESGVVTTKE